MIRLSFLSIAVVLIVGMPSHVQASIVNLTFSGTYKEIDSEEEYAFSYSMTYDTSLDTHPGFYPIGAEIGEDDAPIAHELHGYSASGITELDVQVDGLEWLLSDLVPAYEDAAFWLDVDLATGATPTRPLFLFAPGVNSGPFFLLIGDLGYDVIEPISLIGIDGPEFSADLTVTRSDPDPIPEPASVITWTLLGVVGCIATWWRRRRRAG